MYVGLWEANIYLAAPGRIDILALYDEGWNLPHLPVIPSIRRFLLSLPLLSRVVYSYFSVIHSTAFPTFRMERIRTYCYHCASYFEILQVTAEGFSIQDVTDRTPSPDCRSPSLTHGFPFGSRSRDPVGPFLHAPPAV